jgi:hypothetical protein
MILKTANVSIMYVKQTRSQNEEKNHPPKPYLLLVSKKTHEYKLALRRQVRHSEENKNRAQQQDNLALRQRAMRLKTANVTII